MLSETPGQGCTALSTGRLNSLSLLLHWLLFVCSAEMCPWQRPMRPEGKDTLLVDSDPWLWKTHLASCRKRPWLVESEDWRRQRGKTWLRVGSNLNYAWKLRGAFFLTHPLWFMVDLFGISESTYWMLSITCVSHSAEIHLTDFNRRHLPMVRTSV